MNNKITPLLFHKPLYKVSEKSKLQTTNKKSLEELL